MGSHKSGSGPDLTTAHKSRSRETERSGSHELADHKTSPTSSARKSTGPRTTEGKQRSKYNALKSGIFAKVAVLRGESRAEFGSLLDGFLKGLQPQGSPETTLVEYLAVLIWRKRRCLQAECAEIATVSEFRTFEATQVKIRETWDHLHAGQASGGLLSHTSNHFSIQAARAWLTVFRDELEKLGFQKGLDPWILRRLYGLDNDNEAPLGVFLIYQLYSARATSPPTGSKTPPSPDELKKEMLGVLDKERERLAVLEGGQRIVDEQRGAYQAIAASVPSEDVLERLIRYETHLNREFDRTLSQLERLQRIRLGQPVPPSVRLELSK